jgi:hypothetical protein
MIPGGIVLLEYIVKFKFVNPPFMRYNYNVLIDIKGLVHV